LRVSQSRQLAATKKRSVATTQFTAKDAKYAKENQHLNTFAALRGAEEATN